MLCSFKIGKEDMCIKYICNIEIDRYIERRERDGLVKGRGGGKLNLKLKVLRLTKLP